MSDLSKSFARRSKTKKPTKGEPGKASSPNLSTPLANDAILEELESWIRDGRVKPGQRLPSIKSIQEMLRVGQQGVHMAMESLERRGIIKTRNRSGNYLLHNAREILAAEGTQNLQSAWVLDHYLPRTQKQTLTVFTIDAVGRMRGAWGRAVTAFGEERGFNVNLLTPSDGRLDDLLETHQIDVVHTTPEILQSIGWERFHDLHAPEWREELFSDLLPQVSAKMAARPNTCSMPFAITVNYLFYNRALAARHGLPPAISSDPMEFLVAMRSAQEVLSTHGFDAFHLPGLADVLRMTGGVLVSIDGSVVLDRKQCERTIECLAGSGLPCPNPLSVPGSFVSGRLLAMRHPSFTSAELLERASFDWRAYAVPMALGIRDSAWLTMLAVPKSSPSPEASQALTGHLLSSEMQDLFASVGGNLPVRRSALSALVDADLNHVSKETLHRSLSQSELSWPHMAVAYLGDPEIHNATRDCAQGRLSAEKLFQIFADYVQQHSPRK